MEEISTMTDQTWFTTWFGLTELLGGILLTLMGVWLNRYRGGFTWRFDPKREFNWHPLLMTIGMIFLYANAILIYRTFRNTGKKTLKIIHAFIHVVAFICTIVGLQAAFDSHNLAIPPVPNMYSLHSWFGLGAVIVFACQWVAGFVVFLYPTLSVSLRAAYLPIHISCGREAFALACIAALLGLTEKAIFSVPYYSELSGEAYLINGIGFLIVFFMASVLYMVSLTKYRRQPLPEDEMLLTAQKSTMGLTSSSHDHATHAHGHYSSPLKTVPPREVREDTASPQNTSRSVPIIKLKPFDSYYY